MKNITQNLKPILQAKGLMKRYGTVVAMNGADFDLYPNEVLGVIGDNGAGMSATVAQFSYNIGYMGVENALKLANGETIPDNIDTGTVLVTKENAADFM